MVKREVYKTIRIYKVDHDRLLKEFSKDNNFAEIINQLVTKVLRKLD
jgi:hypothetical protein